MGIGLSVRRALATVWRADRRAIVPLAVVAIASACADLLAPGAPAGIFALQAVGSQALPVTRYEDINLRVTLVADTLVIRGDGRTQHIFWHRTEWLAGVPSPEESRYEERARLLRSRGELLLSRDVGCPAAGPTPCSTRFEELVEWRDGTLVVGGRRYSRVPWPRLTTVPLHRTPQDFTGRDIRIERQRDDVIHHHVRG